MYEKPLEFSHLLDTKYAYSLIYACLIYLCAFLAPLVLNLVPLSKLKSSWKFLITYLLGIGVVSVLLGLFFYPNTLAWAEFPYLDNVLERKGFFPRGISGTKYHFYGIHDLYKYWGDWCKITC